MPIASIEYVLIKEVSNNEMLKKILTTVEEIAREIIQSEREIIVVIPVKYNFVFV